MILSDLLVRKLIVLDTPKPSAILLAFLILTFQIDVVRILSALKMTDVQVELFHEPPGSSSLNGPPFSHFDAEDEPEAALKVHSKPYEEDSLEEGNAHDERSQSPPQEKPLTPPNLSDGEESHKVPERGEEHPQNDMRRQCFTRMVLDTGCDDDDGVITFDAPTPPIIVAKPIQIISPGSPIDSQPKIGMNRIRLIWIFRMGMDDTIWLGNAKVQM